MTSYITITDTETDPEAPLTSELAKKWRDNPIAITEGATGAPRIVPLAINNWYGRVQLDTTTTPVVISGLDSATTLAVVGNFANGTADTASLQISGSTDGGSTWGSWFNLTPSPGAQNTRYGVHIVLNLKNGIYDSVFSDAGDLGAGPFNAIRFSHSVALAGAGNYPARLVAYGIGRAP